MRCTRRYRKAWGVGGFELRVKILNSKLEDDAAAKEEGQKRGAGGGGELWKAHVTRR